MKTAVMKPQMGNKVANKVVKMVGAVVGMGMGMGMGMVVVGGLGVVGGLVGCVRETTVHLAPVEQNNQNHEASMPDAVKKTLEKTPVTGSYEVLENRDDRFIVVLPNRMVVVAQNLPNAPVVSAQYRVKTGSVYEQEFMGYGLSHFLEHLVAGGSTTTRSEAESNDLLASMGGQTNAFTGLDGVGYFINTTSDHTREAVDLLSDWLKNNAVLEEEWARERDVIQREFEMGKGEPARIQWKLTQEARYINHPAKHPTIGYLENFKSITRDQLAEYYHRMYVPNNMVCVVVGDINPHEVVDQVAQIWADRPAVDLPEITFAIEPEMDKAREVTGYADVPHPRVRIGWPGTRLNTNDDVALDALFSILGQGESSRLIREVRDEQQLVTSIGAFNASFEFEDGFVGVDYQTPVPEGMDVQAYIQKVNQAILEQVNQLVEQPVAQYELDRIKRQILSGVVQSNQSAEAMASQLARSIAGLGDPNYLWRYNQRVQALTAEDLQQVARKYCQGEPKMVVKLLPLQEGQVASEEDQLPEQDLTGVPTRTVDLDNRQLAEQIKAHLQEGGQAARAIELDEPVMHTMDNGLRVIIQRSTLVPAVAMDLYALGGLLGDQVGQEGVANAVAVMQTRGAAGQTASDIAEEVESLGATLDTGIGNNTTYATASCLKEDFSTLLDLMSDVVLRPDFPEDEWARVKPRLLAAIDNQSASWNGELGVAFRQAFYEGHPWAYTPLGRREVVEALTAADLKKVHAEKLGADQAVLVVVGDVDVQKVWAEIQVAFKRMPSSARQPFEMVEAAELPKGIQVKQVQTVKPTTAVQLGFGPAVSRNDPDYPAISVMARLSSSFPSGYLDQALRGDGPGLVYAVGAFVRTGVIDGSYEILFNTDAEKAPQAIERAMGVVEQLKHGPIDDQDLAQAKARLLTQEMMGKQTLSARAADLALNELYDAKQMSGQAYLDAVSAVDQQDVYRVAQEVTGRGVMVILNDQIIDSAALEQAIEIKHLP